MSMWHHRTASSTSQRRSVGLRSVTVDVIWAPWIHRHVQETSLRRSELCDTSSQSEEGECGHKGLDTVSDKTRVGMELKRCSVGTKGPKVCPENTPQSITPPAAWTVNTAGRIHAFMLFTPSSDPTDSVDQCFCFWWVFVSCSFCFLFLADRSGPRCGLLKPICFELQCVDAGQTVAFISWEVSILMDLWRCLPAAHCCFLAFGLFSVNLEMVVWEHPSTSPFSEMLRPKSLKSLQPGLSMSRCVKALSWSHVIGWLDIWMSLTGVPNAMASEGTSCRKKWQKITNKKKNKR